MLVEIWSDVVCPWCYIGKRRFETALERFDGRDEVEIVFRPFQLDPGAPPVASPVIDAYARKFGGPDRAIAIIGQLTDLAEKEGLDFRLDEAQRVNTIDAHRLVEFARAEGRANELYERLLAAYFTEGRDLGDHATLATLAGEAGLDPEAAAAYLASDAGYAEVRHGLARAAELDIHAVPTFVIDGAWPIPGAQDPDTFLKVLEKRAAAHD